MVFSTVTKLYLAKLIKKNNMNGNIIITFKNLNK